MRLRVCVCSLALLAIGCASDPSGPSDPSEPSEPSAIEDAGSPPAQEARAPIDPLGGTIDGPRGLRVAVPPGAVTSPVELFIEARAPFGGELLRDGERSIGPSFALQITAGEPEQSFVSAPAPDRAIELSIELPAAASAGTQTYLLVSLPPVQALPVFGRTEGTRLSVAFQMLPPAMQIQLVEGSGYVSSIKRSGLLSSPEGPWAETEFEITSLAGVPQDERDRAALLLGNAARYFSERGFRTPWLSRTAGGYTAVLAPLSFAGTVRYELPSAELFPALRAAIMFSHVTGTIYLNLGGMFRNAEGLLVPNYPDSTPAHELFHAILRGYGLHNWYGYARELEDAHLCGVRALLGSCPIVGYNEGLAYVAGMTVELDQSASLATPLRSDGRHYKLSRPLALGNYSTRNPGEPDEYGRDVDEEYGAGEFFLWLARRHAGGSIEYFDDLLRAFANAGVSYATLEAALPMALPASAGLAADHREFTYQRAYARADTVTIAGAEVPASRLRGVPHLPELRDPRGLDLSDQDSARLIEDLFESDALVELAPSPGNIAAHTFTRVVHPLSSRAVRLAAPTSGRNILVHLNPTWLSARLYQGTRWADFEDGMLDLGESGLSARESAVLIIHNSSLDTATPIDVVATAVPDETGSAPPPPVILAAPSVTAGAALPVLIELGADPDGDPVAVRCSSEGSSYPPGADFLSGFDAGGRTVVAQFVWSSPRSARLTCACADPAGHQSAPSEVRIEVVSGPEPADDAGASDGATDGGSEDAGVTADASIALVLIPAGSFTMGAPPAEPGNGGDEAQHPVTLTRAFWLTPVEVTFAEWDRVMGSAISAGRDIYPVDFVTWDEAVEFTNFLSLQSSLPPCYLGGPGNWIFVGLDCEGFRLPTEAEWEYAARAGTTGPYAGPSLDLLGWYDGNSPLTSPTQPAGTKLPNAWGLHDMHGNVWEWVQDWYGAYDSIAVDPQGPAAGLDHVIRGGCASCSAENCRSATRYHTDGFGQSHLGFRVAKSVSTTDGGIPRDAAAPADAADAGSAPDAAVASLDGGDAGFDAGGSGYHVYDVNFGTPAPAAWTRRGDLEPNPATLGAQRIVLFNRGGEIWYAEGPTMLAALTSTVVRPVSNIPPTFMGWPFRPQTAFIFQDSSGTPKLGILDTGFFTADLAHIPNNSLGAAGPFSIHYGSATEASSYVELARHPHMMASAGHFIFGGGESFELIDLHTATSTIISVPMSFGLCGNGTLIGPGAMVSSWSRDITGALHCDLRAADDWRANSGPWYSMTSLNAGSSYLINRDPRWHSEALIYVRAGSEGSPTTIWYAPILDCGDGTCLAHETFTCPVDCP